MAIISVKLSNNLTRKTVMVDSATPIRKIFEDNDIEYSNGVTSLDGASLPAGSMDKSLEELGVTGDSCYLMVSVKADCASDELAPECNPIVEHGAPAVACVKVVGNAAVVVSSADLDDVKTLAKYRPEALMLYKGEGKDKEPVFMVSTGKGDGSINKNGAVFGSATTADGKATITLRIPEGTEDVKAWVEEAIGVSILHLKKVEAQFADALDEVKTEKKAVAESISIA